VSEELKEVLSSIIASGYQLSSDGFELLGTLEGNRLKQVVRLALRAADSSTTDITIIDREFLQKVLEEDRAERTIEKPVVTMHGARPLASEHDGGLRFLDEPPSEPLGDMEGFVEYFRSRFKTIEGIIRRRIDVRDAVTIGNALDMPLRSKVKVIGIVTNKRSSGPRLFVDLEDREDSVTVMASEGEALRKGLSLLEDQVICVDAVKYREDLLIANDFIWPDIPSQPPKRSEVPLCAAFLADVHVGSRHFQEGLFKKFVSWMNLNIGPSRLKMMASRVKYVIIAGDLVDGIGVYPNQLDELDISDIEEQYEVAAGFISELPDYVEIIILPGNHDAVRKSLPQPPISKEYAASLHGDDRIHLLGNPARILLDGVETFISHGKALDDILSQIPGMGFDNPLGGMELLLRCRHVAPIYGASTPIAPEREDRLVIASTPDIFQMGHIHVFGYRKYKGATLIASGSWQEQTPFQKRVNLTPTVGVAPIVDLQTHQVAALDFKMLG
jgi:DNA polymerase II small subunit